MTCKDCEKFNKNVSCCDFYPSHPQYVLHEDHKPNWCPLYKEDEEPNNIVRHKKTYGKFI